MENKKQKTESRDNKLLSPRLSLLWFLSSGVNRRKRRKEQKPKTPSNKINSKGLILFTSVHLLCLIKGCEERFHLKSAHSVRRLSIIIHVSLYLSFCLFSSRLLRFLFSPRCFLFVSREKRNWDFLASRILSGGGWCSFVGLAIYKGPSHTFFWFNTSFRGKMEGNKQKGISSSFPSELFGSIKESHHYPSSSAAGGIFASIFSPPSSKTKVCFSFQHLDFSLILLVLVVGQISSFVFAFLHFTVKFMIGFCYVFGCLKVRVFCYDMSFTELIFTISVWITNLITQWVFAP